MRLEEDRGARGKAADPGDASPLAVSRGCGVSHAEKRALGVGAGARAPHAGRDLFAREALDMVPQILTLQDRNPHSPTYGCFDRDFWHYKVTDFPCGMAQELVWPLALAWDTGLAGNPFHRSDAIRAWADAGVRYAARSSHRDGSCDDYYPYERASGAAAFSLLACIEASSLLSIGSDEVLSFIARRADWLARRRESGRLSNHEALIALALARAGRLLDTDRWSGAQEERVVRVLSWQDSEGWFQEYEGCDPGYLTLTLGALADLWAIEPTQDLEGALHRAVGFVCDLVAPDGSLGGELGSRNTHVFFPHGFERVGVCIPEALEVNDRFLVALSSGRAACHRDDRLIGHHAWSYLLAWRYAEKSAGAGEAKRSRGFSAEALQRRRGRLVFPNAGLVIDRREEEEMHVALSKGGAFKLFRGGELVASDTQVSLLVRRRTLRTSNAVAHLIDRYPWSLEGDAVTIQGAFGWAKQTSMSTWRLILLRVAMATAGRLVPDCARRLLQRLLITGKSNAPFRFRRTLSREGGLWKVRDEVFAASWKDVVAIGIGGHQTSIYVAMSRPFRKDQLVPWLDLTAEILHLVPGEALVVERTL